MSRTPGNRARATVYRLGGSRELRALLRTKYLDRPAFAAEPVMVAGTSGLLVAGQIQAEKVPWADGLGTYTGIDLALNNDTAAAVLMLSLDDHVYALCYGMGFHPLNYGQVEPGFGLQYLARVADVEDLRSVTRHTIDRTASIDRRSIPSGGDVRAFGLAELGVVVSKVIGRGVTPEGKPVTIRGADALSMPLPRDPAALISELKAIGATLMQPITHPDLELLTRLTPLQPHHPRGRLSTSGSLRRFGARLTSASALDGPGSKPMSSAPSSLFVYFTCRAQTMLCWLGSPPMISNGSSSIDHAKPTGSPPQDQGHAHG